MDLLFCCYKKQSGIKFAVFTVDFYRASIGQQFAAFHFLPKFIKLTEQFEKASKDAVELQVDWAKLLVKKGLKSRLTGLDAKVKPMLAMKVQAVLVNLQLHDKFTDLHYTFFVEEKVQAVVSSLDSASLRASLADFVQAKAVLREDLNELSLLEAFEKGA